MKVWTATTQVQDACWEEEGRGGRGGGGEREEAEAREDVEENESEEKQSSAGKDISRERCATQCIMGYFVLNGTSAGTSGKGRPGMY